MRKTIRRISKKTMALMLTGMLMLTSITSAFASYTIKRFKTSTGQPCNVKMSSGTIGTNKYALTSIMEDEKKHNYNSMYIDVELFCSGIENPYDDKTVYGKSNVSITVNNANGGVSYGKGVTHTNVGDDIWGYGGTTLYN